MVYYLSRRSTQMPPQDKLNLVQGTLDMLILRTLLFGPAHGHQIARHIQRTSEDVLQVEHGSLYPALHRLEKKGLLEAEWRTDEPGQVRQLKYYSLTTAGKKRLRSEESKWRKLARAIGLVMNPAKGG